MIKSLYRIYKNYWPRSLILCYHRVGNYVSDPVDITVTQSNFFDQINWLKNEFNIISIDKLNECLKNNIHLPDKSVIITFDDGYQSYSKIIKFFVEQNLPIIFFLCTPTFKNRFFYWDILNYLLIENREISNDNYDLLLEFCKKEELDILPEKDIDELKHNQTISWKINSKPYPTNRCRIYEILSRKCENLDGYNNILLDNINSIGLELNTQQSFFIVDGKISNSLINIGAHTLNHYCLSKLNRDDQTNEIIRNKNKLENILPFPIKYFAYPYGTNNHYNQYSINIVKSNFNLGLSNFQGLIHKDSNPYELPRFLIRDWPLEIFQNKIKSFFNHRK